MSKLFVVIILVVVGFFVYQNYAGSSGEFDSNGNPKAVLVVSDHCPPCRDAENYLTRKKVEYEIMSAEDGQRVPLLKVGNSSFAGFNENQFLSVLGKEFGLAKLTKSDAYPFKFNFNTVGQPRVVMYGTSWCGYCQQAKTYFSDNNIEYIEYDIESDSSANQRFLRLQGAGTPLIYFGFDRIEGFNKRRLDEVL